MKTSWDYNENLFEELIKFIKSKNGDPKNPESICHFDQIHAGGFKATSHIISLSNVTENTTLLDLGGGIGGVARMFASKLNCKVVSLDYSLNYNITGKKLTDLCNVKNVFFINADATSIPLKNNSIEFILLQHLNMNIRNKEKLFQECSRVLKKNGTIIFHEWFIKDDIKQKTLNFPLPWSDTKEFSFLIKLKEFLALALKYGFEIVNLEDDSNQGLKFYKKIYTEKNFSNPIFSKRDPERIFENIISALEDNILELYIGILKLTDKIIS